MVQWYPGSGSSLCNRRLVPYHLGQGWQFSSWTSRSLLGHPHHSTSTVTIVHANLIKHFRCVLLLGDGEKGKGAKHLTPKNLLFIDRQSLQSLYSIKKCKYGQYHNQPYKIKFYITCPNLKIYVTKFLLQCLLMVRQDHWNRTECVEFSGILHNDWRDCLSIKIHMKTHNVNLSSGTRKLGMLMLEYMWTRHITSV